jgi:putative ABC transport system permease protein
MYLPAAASPQYRMTVVLRSTLPPASLAGALRAAVNGIDNGVALSRVEPMGAVLSASTAAPRFRTGLLGAFAGVAFLLAIVGLYGSLSYTVSQRTRELGIRMALGAERRQVLGLVVGQGLLLAGIGLALGLAAALAGSRLLGGLLFEVSPAEPAVYAVVTAGLLVASLAACLVPARRASRVDPAVTLRAE